MRISELKFGKDKLFCVYINGEFACKISDEAVYKHHLKNDMELTEELYDNIMEIAGFEAAMRDGMRILSHSSNTRLGLLQKLKLKGHDSDSIKKVLRFFEEKGLINDKAYAINFVHDAVQLKKMGKYRIEFELRNKGIASDIIEEVTQDIEEADNLSAVVEKEIDKMQCRDRKHIDKLKRKLYSKGYSIYDINDAIAEYIGGENSEI